MKAIELMIGDWVHRPDCSDKVTSILPHSIYGLDKLRGTICEEELGPILLTKDMLEKNGWNFTRGEIFSYRDFDKRLDIILFKSSDGKDWHLHIEGTLKKRVLYVHELQHALRLCGLTELADNFEVE